MTGIVLGSRHASLRERAWERESPLRRLDWVLTLAVVALVVLGALLVWSATRPRLVGAGLDPDTFLKKHLINAGIGGTLACAAALVDYRAMRTYAPLVYVASVLGLVAVLTPLGATINGAHSWIELPAGFQVQPSEFAKVALVVLMAVLLAETRDRDGRPGHRDVVLVLGLSAVPLALVLAQPDLGTVMVLVVLVLGVIAVSGAPLRWVGGLVAVGVILGALVAPHLLSSYQKDRFAAFTNTEIDPRGVGYNTRQARLAIGSGGFTGTGLGQGAQTQGQFIPEQQTDFVFTVAGEELGLVGGSAIIALLGLVLLRGVRIASLAADAFGRLVAVGVVCWFAFQSFVNIGMTLGIMPVTGLPLPFLSYGGSAMFANLLAIGLLQNVHLRSAQP